MWRRQLITGKHDIAVIGSGFAGSLLAMIAKRLGHSVVLLEKDRHPRFAMGESSTPLTNLLLEELSVRHNVPAITSLSKWGTWQRAHPEIACGLKRGFTFYHHKLGEQDTGPASRGEQLLVAASPHDAIADTHWYRADFDHFLVRQAQEIGVEYLDGVALTNATERDDEIRLSGAKDGEDFKICARFVVDATGPRGFLHQALRLPEVELPGMPKTRALYSHFSSVGNYADIKERDAPPYPIDSAAVHHVFDGGWIWALKFNNGITSAGVAATDHVANQLNFRDGSAAWQRLLHAMPTIERQFAQAQPERPFTHIPQLTFRSGNIAGRRWALLPSAAGFVDPLLSTGFALTLLGVGRLATFIESQWESPTFAEGLKNYASQTDGELLATAHLVGSLYASMNDFPLFTSLSLLYFAAVIFSETARRLGKKHLANSFLLFDHPEFGPRCRDIFDRVRSCRTPDDSARLQCDILSAIRPINLAGLGEPHRRNWYPVDASDLYASAWKVGATAGEISAMLAQCGFQPKLQTKQNS